MEQDYSNFPLGFTLATLGSLLQAIGAGALQVMQDKLPEFQLNTFRYMYAITITICCKFNMIIWWQWCSFVLVKEPTEKSASSLQNTL